MTIIATTTRLVLRCFRTDDAQDLHVMMSDPELARFAEWEPYSWPETEAEVARLAALPTLEVGRWAEYAIEVPAEGRFIGCVTMRIENERDRQAELGWWLAGRDQGRGLATEAVRALMHYGKGAGVHRFFAAADARNSASIRLMQRVGMRQEAIFQERSLIKGEWCDEVVYALLARELSDDPRTITEGAS
jgi:[ribosomal protein S5]-alanine N-acetyltransferase